MMMRQATPGSLPLRAEGRNIPWSCPLSQGAKVARSRKSFSRGLTVGSFCHGELHNLSE
jgi:hypothetical protein